MRIIVTGVNGFLGSHMAKYLSAQGHEVIGCSRLLREKKPAPMSKYVDCDLSDRIETDKLFGAFSNVDRLYHFAADVGGSQHLKHSGKTISNNNVLINVSVFHAASRAKIPTIIFPSSVNVYDANNSEYRSERLISENLARRICKNSNVHIVRLSNVLGPGCPWKGRKARVVAALCRQAIQKNGEITIQGDGTQKRVFIHVDDAIRALSIIPQESRPRDILDLGVPIIFTINDIVSMIENVRGPLTKKYQDRKIPDTLDLKTATFKSATNKITWYPGMPIDRAVQDTYEWVRHCISKLDKPPVLSEK